MSTRVIILVALAAVLAFLLVMVLGVFIAAATGYVFGTGEYGALMALTVTLAILAGFAAAAGVYQCRSVL